MTTARSVAYPIMDLLHPDDTMDLASSPHIPANDFDLTYELDTMRDASAEPTQEAMIEDPINPNQHSAADIQLVDEDFLDDDEMVDEDTVVQNADANPEDFTMESRSQALPGAEHEDEDILYDEDEPVREDNNQAEDTRDVEIVDDEDLFPEDEELPEHSLEDTSRISQALHNNYDGERVYEEQTTNIITQDSEDVGATQGPLFSGDSANNISDDGPNDPTHLEDDETIPKLDHGPPTDTVAASKMTSKEPPLSPLETANNHQTSSLLDQAKLDSAGPSVPDEPEGATVVEAAQFSTCDVEYAKSAGGESVTHRTEVEDADEADHQLHTAALHTVKVNYQDTEICLFPPNEGDDSETFFLADVDLAHQSLDTLLTACHDVLIGTIGDDDELVLDIPSLGLHICQDSSYATQMTLSQILDVYLALCHNEQTEKVEPLYCHLSSRVSLASQHAYLLSAIEQGKAFTEIAAEHLHSHDGSPDQWEVVDDVIESHGENHEDLGRNERDNDGDLARENTDLEDTNLGAEQDNLDYHPQEGATTEHVPSEEESDSNALESKPETDDYDVTGDAENETSATSTVRGDELEVQGEYDPLSDICYADGLCYCLDCDANMYADFDTSHDDLAEFADMPPIPGNDAEHNGGVVISIDDATQDEDGKAETQSAVEDTESSRTIEAGDDAFDQTMNADPDAERESLVDNHEDFHDSAGPEELEDRTTELDDTGGQDQVNSESVHDVGLHGDDQLLQDSAEFATNAAASDSKRDSDHILHVQTGGEHNGLSGQEAPVDETNGSAENETSAQGNGQVDISPIPLSKGMDHKARAEHGAIQTTVEEDDLFLGDDDAKASMHEVTAPATPYGTKSSKRKTRDDDDEFGLSESGTPDIKRRRPS